jgi:AcrR family transcriptional regulator
MAPRRRLPREQRRRKLLEAARAQIMERGYGELTMERVAARAGVSKALVYDHFSHRRDLYLAVLADERARLVERLAPAIAYGDRETRVRSGVTAFLELIEEYGDGYVELFRNPVAHDPELAEALTELRDGVAEMVAGFIAGDVGLPVEAVRLPAHAVVGPREQRPTQKATVALLSRLIWQGLEGVGEMAPVRRGSDEVVELERRRR